MIITPDGPRGPKYRIKSGPVLLASKTGGRLVPFTINASKCWQLKSWDNFQIPKPGAKLVMRIGTPISVPPTLTDEEVEAFRLRTEQAMREITVDPEP